MAFVTFVEEPVYDNNSLEMMTLTNLINNLDLDFNGTVEHIKVDQFKNRQLLSFNYQCTLDHKQEVYSKQIS